MNKLMRFFTKEIAVSKSFERVLWSVVTMAGIATMAWIMYVIWYALFVPPIGEIGLFEVLALALCVAGIIGATAYSTSRMFQDE